MLRAGKLSSIAKTAIAGMMECAGALTALATPIRFRMLREVLG